MKKILFILFVAQFILAPYIIKGYGANLVEDNYEYSGVAQGRETVEKDIFCNRLSITFVIANNSISQNIFLYSFSRIKKWNTNKY